MNEKSPEEVVAEAASITTTKAMKRHLHPEGDRFGLIMDFDYKFDDFGFVDWRAIIPESFLFINKKKFEEAGKDVPTDIEGLDDSEVIIKLGGIKWLARVRGYESVSYEVVSADSQNVIVKCLINWIPNFENPIGSSYEEIASCNAKNADSFHLQFAESIAANRAFVRCVRNFLNVNIVGEEEVANKIPETKPSSEDPSHLSIDPQTIFFNKAKEKGKTFEEIAGMCAEADPLISEAVKDKGLNDAALIKLITPKAAKKLLRMIRKV